MTQAELISLARQTANTFQLFDYIVCGICEKESSWNPWAIRYEADFQKRYVQALGLDPTITVARSISWGLMQTIGQSVREIGYVDDFPKLCDPATGLEWGCKLFLVKLEAAGGNYEKALLLWNGGGDAAYPASVIALAEKYRPQTT
jgi:soluble lytic murein transglycosylase-like protein